MADDEKMNKAEAIEEAPAPPPAAPRWRRVARNGVRVAAGLAIGLVIAEIAFYVRDGGAFPHLNIYVEDAERGVRLRPLATERISFSNNPITSVRINSEGYRGAEWAPASPDEVVVVGDSQVFGLGVEEGETFSAALQTALGGKQIVRNLGVPTYGPGEYNAALDEALTKRPAKTVIFTVNVANDLFEATRPNKERHAVWDGWAVRKETAPSAVTSFPGRSFLYTRSHAFYALRRWSYDRGPKVDEGGFASEGTWQDIGDAAQVAGRERATAAEENARLARLRKNELESATESAGAVQAAVEQKVVDSESDLLRDRDEPDDIFDERRKAWLSKRSTYRAARLSPGDIVTVESGENSRNVRVNAEHIRRGTALRLLVEKEARRKAEAARDAKTVALFDRRDELEKKLAALQAAAPPKVEPLSPLTPALRETKAICDKHGARLLVVALPIDVQVSPKEWEKYGVAPLDMEPTKVLLEDLVVAARSIGAEGLDATPALAAAEPGAFLHGDIHMTAKGHHALGEAIAKALKAPRFDVPREGLPAGRSYPPKPEEWTPETEIAVRESDPAGCETKHLREWVGIFCRNKGGAKGVIVSSGTEVSAGTVPGASFLIAPAIHGQDVKATFVFEGMTRELVIKSPEAENAVIEFSKPLPAASAPVPVAPDTDAFCTCFVTRSPGSKCSMATSAADADCARSYGNDCTKLLACAAGSPSSLPSCPPGSANAGAAGRCHALCSRDVPCKSGQCSDWQGGRVCM